VAVSLIVVFAIVALAGVSVVLFSDGRTGDEPITGSVPDATTAVDGRVDDALALETEGKAVEALQLYDEILASDPDNVEALAYRGWLLKRAGLADEALASLDRAVAVDPTFADAHFFRGMVLYQDRDDPAGAVIEFQAFLANNPPPDFVDAVGEVLAQAQAAAAAKATTPTPTTTAP
jgi:tetratricopeptide (TPR) repeat protein